MSVDRYDVIGSLGSGHFTAGVYKCRHIDLDREVAVKLLRVDNGSRRDELLREARTMSSIGRHENVVQVLDAGDWNAEHVYLAVELCRDGSLLSAIPEHGLDPAAACRMVSDSCRGLDFMHRRGLLHLDIRPANILLSDQVPKLGDFGLARWTRDPGVPFVYGPHAAPEMLCGGSGTELADQYAMAMTLGHLLTNGLICSDPVPDEITEAAWRTCHSVDSLGANVPDRLKKVIRTATSFRPERRFRDIERFKQAVDAATPAVSFTLGSEGRMSSSDGCWTVEQLSTAGVYRVDVKRQGRRYSAHCLSNGTEIDAQTHVRRVANALAYR